MLVLYVRSTKNEIRRARIKFNVNSKRKKGKEKRTEIYSMH